MPTAYPVVLVTGEAARLLGVSRKKIKQWIDSGLMTGYRIPGSNHERRVELQEALVFAHRHGLPTEALEGLAEHQGVIPLRCPSLLLVSPCLEQALPLLRQHFDVTLALSGLRSGMILARRTFAAVLLDAALGTAETAEHLELLAERCRESYVGVLAREDEAPDSWLERGAAACWQRPCHWQKLARELWQALVATRQAGTPGTRGPRLAKAA